MANEDAGERDDEDGDELKRLLALAASGRSDMMGGAGMLAAIPKLEEAFDGLILLATKRSGDCSEERFYAMNVLLYLAQALRVGGRRDEAKRCARQLAYLGQAYEQLSFASAGELLLGTLAFHEGRNEEALQIYERAEELALKGGNELARANAVEHRGDVLFRLGRNEEALDAYKQAEQFALKNGHALSHANVLISRGEVFFRLGRNEEALHTLEKAERICLQAGYAIGHANVIRNRGHLLTRLGRTEEALSAYELADTLAVKLRDGSNRASIARGRGAVLFRLGRTEEALEAFLCAEQFARNVQDQLGRANATTSRGEVLFRLGRNEEAQQAFELAEQLAASVGADGARANAVHGLGDVLFRLGHNEEALRAFEQVERLADNVGSDLGRANALKSRGDVLFRLERNEEALRAYEQAEQFALKMGSDLGRASAAQSRSDVLFRLGRNKEALRVCELAEQFATNAGSALSRANALKSRANVRFDDAVSEGNRELFLEAEELIERARTLHQEQGVLHNVINDRQIHASALIRFEQHVRAVDVCTEGLADVEHLRQLDVSPLVRATVGEGATDLLRTLIEGHLALRDPHSAVVAFEQRRNWTLDAQRTHRLQRPEAVSSTDWNDFVRLRDRVAREADTRIATPESLHVSREERARLVALTERITPLLAPASSASSRDPLAALITARTTTAGWALLAFQPTLLDGRLCCLFASPHHVPVHLTLTATRNDLAAPLNALLEWQSTQNLHDRPIEQWRRVLGQLGAAILDSEFSSVLSLDAADAMPEAKTLRALLTECPGAELRILPSELLTLVPWSALPWDNGYLVEHHAVVMSSSLESAFAPPAPLPSRRALVVGNPTGDLPFAGWEARVVSLLLRNDGFEVSEYRADTPPTAETVLAEAPQHALVQLSTHAAMDLSQPANSGIRFGGGTVARLPALLDLHLRGCTVVLSACQTGLSDPNRALDTVSLSAALLAAGAARALGTLWTVHDTSTALLVVEVYRRALAGTPWPVALQQTQLAMLRGTLSLASLPHDAPAPPEVGSRQKPTRVMSQTPLGVFASPYHWGAFQLYGR